MHGNHYRLTGDLGKEQKLHFLTYTICKSHRDVVYNSCVRLMPVVTPGKPSQQNQLQILANVGLSVFCIDGILLHMTIQVFSKQ